MKKILILVFMMFIIGCEKKIFSPSLSFNVVFLDEISKEPIEGIRYYGTTTISYGFGAYDESIGAGLTGKNGVLKLKFKPFKRATSYQYDIESDKYFIYNKSLPRLPCYASKLTPICNRSLHGKAFVTPFKLK